MFVAHVVIFVFKCCWLFLSCRRASGSRAIGAGFAARIGQGKPLLWHAFLVAEKAAAKALAKKKEKQAAIEAKRKDEQKHDENYMELKRRKMSNLMLTELAQRAEEEDWARRVVHEQQDSGGASSSSGLVRNPNPNPASSSSGLVRNSSGSVFGLVPRPAPAITPATVMPEGDSDTSDADEPAVDEAI